MDAAEDFFKGHCPPTSEEVKSISERSHPHVRDFNNLSVSPSFGVSKVKQLVADILKPLSAEVAADSYSSNNGDNANKISALQLRGGQLEGVKLLLGNCWNRCSCILADDM